MEIAIICNEENLLDDEAENRKIINFLKKVDENYYHRKIQNRKEESKVFPHRGEDGRLFLKTFGYVKLSNINKEE